MGWTAHRWPSSPPLPGQGAAGKITKRPRAGGFGRQNKIGVDRVAVAAAYSRHLFFRHPSPSARTIAERVGNKSLLQAHQRANQYGRHSHRCIVCVNTGRNGPAFPESLFQDTVT